MIAEESTLVAVRLCLGEQELHKRGIIYFKGINEDLKAGLRSLRKLRGLPEHPEARATVNDARSRPQSTGQDSVTAGSFQAVFLLRFLRFRTTLMTACDMEV
jgi:hypothetical protein